MLLGDAGKHINISGGNVIIPTGVYTVGDAVTVYNSDTVDRTIDATTNSVTLTQAGTTNTGDRTIKQNGLATLLCIGSNSFVISGVGLL